MSKTPLPAADDSLSIPQVFLNARGHFVEPGQDLDELSDGREIQANQLSTYLKQNIVLPEGTTDFFVWVHGWQNSQAGALASARRLFKGIVDLRERQADRYPKLANFNPAFLMVRWPSQSSFMPWGYQKIRNRAAQMTENGEAEYFLASVLGYLDQHNSREGGMRTLAAADGFFVHCLGHSFGGRFLTAAVAAAAAPKPGTLAAEAAERFPFTVDSMLVFQMAAPSSAFETQLSKLVDPQRSPFRSPLVATFSSSDRANCLWHWLAGNGRAIGCCGVKEPHDKVATIPLGDLGYDYKPQDFAREIVNVDASAVYTNGNFITGAHGDFFYEESIHLALSLANHAH